MRMPYVVVVGSANHDVVIRQQRFPGPGETVFGHSVEKHPGGKGLNQAIALARAGTLVHFSGRVGRDESGRQLRSELLAAGVSVEALIEGDEPTGAAYVSVLDSGENSIVVVPGANASSCRLDGATRDLVAGARFVVAQLERPIDLVREAFSEARRHGVTTVLTPAPVQVLDASLLMLTDILVPNALEARALAGEQDEERAAHCLSHSVEVVVMTRGERGVLVAQRGKTIATVPARVVNAIDTTGAGDTFVGFLIGALCRDSDLEAALREATVAASIAVTRRGAASAMPSLSEVTTVLA